ncbi:Dipeptidyl peptidase 9 [Hondaea fermentalgiana]|uniref:Dipeptidyl peptidase 9 n=1 Tax=Hondaea fermentalgiana TaxID=2315210 RepID=A0A2R5GLV6_9STRA|nr:Dipeptidyl peptidase 9 [Hondaea fermentalgiana]|eukprot:GBG31615.1 Dipeptidyl peptidase 9 [Hondaea fermentalgiana]
MLPVIGARHVSGHGSASPTSSNNPGLATKGSDILKRGAAKSRWQASVDHDSGHGVQNAKSNFLHHVESDSDFLQQHNRGDFGAHLARNSDSDADLRELHSPEVAEDVDDGLDPSPELRDELMRIATRVQELTTHFAELTQNMDGRNAQLGRILSKIRARYVNSFEHLLSTTSKMHAAKDQKLQRRAANLKQRERDLRMQVMTLESDHRVLRAQTNATDLVVRTQRERIEELEEEVAHLRTLLRGESNDLLARVKTPRKQEGIHEIDHAANCNLRTGRSSSSGASSSDKTGEYKREEEEEREGVDTRPDIVELALEAPLQALDTLVNNFEDQGQAKQLILSNMEMLLQVAENEAKRNKANDAKFMVAKLRGDDVALVEMQDKGTMTTAKPSASDSDTQDIISEDGQKAMRARAAYTSSESSRHERDAAIRSKNGRTPSSSTETETIALEQDDSKAHENSQQSVADSQTDRAGSGLDVPRLSTDIMIRVMNSNKNGFEMPSELSTFLANLPPNAMDAAPPTLEWVLERIQTLYDDKLEADQSDASDGLALQTLGAFTIEQFLYRHGVRRVAELRLFELLQAVRAHMKKHTRVKLFARFLDAYHYKHNETDQRICNNHILQVFLQIRQWLLRPSIAQEQHNAVLCSSGSPNPPNGPLSLDDAATEVDCTIPSVSFADHALAGDVIEFENRTYVPLDRAVNFLRALYGTFLPPRKVNMYCRAVEKMAAVHSEYTNVKGVRVVEIRVPKGVAKGDRTTVRMHMRNALLHHDRNEGGKSPGDRTHRIDKVVVDIDRALESLVKVLLAREHHIDEKLRTLFIRGDTDGDGVLSFHEFTRILQTANSSLSSRKVLRIFREACTATNAASAGSGKRGFVSISGSSVETMSQLDDLIVAARPLPGIIAPSQPSFSPCRKYLAFLCPDSSDNLLNRQLYCLELDQEGNAQGSAFKLWDPAASSEESNTEETLSLEDKLRRERSRQMSVGITQYAWSSSPSLASRMLIPLNGNIFMKEMQPNVAAPPRKVFDKVTSTAPGDDARGGALDPHMSPDGRMVAFVRDAELYVLEVDADAPTPQRLTYDSRGNGKTSGLADFIAQEEMDRYHGFWWSHDSQHIAFELVDESHIPEYRIMHQGKEEVGDSAQEDHRYPFAGKANPHVRLGVVSVAASGNGQRPSVRWLDISLKEGSGDNDMYLARVDWLPDGSLSAQLENREQSELLLVRYDINSGQRTLLKRETSDVWINLHDLFVSFDSMRGEQVLGLSDGKDGAGADASGDVAMQGGDEADAAAWQGQQPCGFFFIWGSESETRFMKLYLYFYSSQTGKVQLVRKLCDDGPWMVTSLVQVDLERGLLYYAATRESVLERHVYCVSLWSSADAATEGRALTKSFAGMNSMVMDADGDLAVLTHHSILTPPTTQLFRISGDSCERGISQIYTLHAGKESSLVHDELERLQPLLVTPELIEFPAPSDGPLLHGALYRPDPEQHGDGPFPTIVAVYGGPHVQRVTNGWDVTVDMRAQRLVNAGYAVLKVDNRGSSGRGLDFEGAIKHRMGTVEVDDQVEGVLFLERKGIADRSRVGMYGWSYGGYMSAMCLLKRPDVFHVAIAGAPVTHWDGYDTHYTERYMGTPLTNPRGYEEGAVMAHVRNLQGKLMLVHGLIDENVHFRHTARLINALIAEAKPYDLLLFPDERHSPRRLQDRIYMEKRMKEYFDEHLGSESGSVAAVKKKRT